MTSVPSTGPGILCEQMFREEQREREASNNIEDICLLLKKNFLSSHATLEDKLQFPQLFNGVNDFLGGLFGLHLIKCVSGLG